jgi:hypothetical protein
MNVFRCMYHRPLEHLASNSSDVVLRTVVSMLRVSEYLGCMQMLAPSIESALWPNQSFVQEAIAVNPTGWLSITAKLRSTNLFGEALIHATGQYNRLDDQEIRTLEEPIRKILERKVRDLAGKKASVELNLITYIPNQLRPSGSMRQDYAENIWNWQAFGIYQHWMGSQLCIDRGRNAIDGGLSFYRTIYDGQYLIHDDLKSTWFDACPMTIRAQRTLSNRIDMLKERASHVVSELLESNIQLDSETFPVDYLTCVPFDKENDVPWATNPLE